MDANLEMVIKKLVRNEIKESKQYLEAYFNFNNKKCDAELKQYVLDTLKRQSRFLEVPRNCKNLLIAEDVSDSDSFEFRRYIRTKEDNHVITHVERTHSLKDKLQEIGIKYINSLLLYGPPGCGKTLMGRYIANRTGLPFVYLSFGNLIDSLLGKTGKNLETAFDYIRDVPSVLMLDEMDAIGLMRLAPQSGAESESARITIVLMQCLDRLASGSIVIGATNRIDMLDKAILRRFSVRHEIAMPSPETKVRIVENYLSTIKGAEYTEESIRAFLLGMDGFEDISPSDIIASVNEKIIGFLAEGKNIRI